MSFLATAMVTWQDDPNPVSKSFIIDPEMAVGADGSGGMDGMGPDDARPVPAQRSAAAGASRTIKR
jgi:hypothetical protein